MRRLLLVLCAFLLGTPALAQEPEWRAAPEYDVLLTTHGVARKNRRCSRR